MKRLTEEERAEIIALYSTTKNKSEIARKMGVSESSVRKVLKEKDTNPDYAKIYEISKKRFVERSTEIIDIGLDRLRNTLSDLEKDIPARELTTVIGTLFDKRALAMDESTENSQIKVVLSDEVMKYAK